MVTASEDEMAMGSRWTLNKKCGLVFLFYAILFKF